MVFPLLFFLLCFSSSAPAEEVSNKSFSLSLSSSAHPNQLPLFLADLPNPNDFSLFATSGWDGNWYVGYNACWIQKITVPPKGNTRKVFAGAKLGRMKWVEPVGKQPWQKAPMPGEVYIAVASTPAWSKKDFLPLVNSKDIPLESDAQTAVEGVAESRWFWTEVPVEKINFGGDIFLALWSPSERWVRASSAPVLAAGWGSRESGTWLNTEVKGEPPSNPKKSLQKPVTIFEPAVALKLVAEESRPPSLKIIRVEFSEKSAKNSATRVVWCSVQGESIERAWIEISIDGKTWNRFGRFLWNAPYVFTLKMEDLPLATSGKMWARVKAADFFESVGESEPVNLLDELEGGIKK